MTELDHCRRRPSPAPRRRRRRGPLARLGRLAARCARTRCSGSRSSLIVLFVLMAIWPSLFTKTDPDVGDIKQRAREAQRGRVVRHATSRATTSTPAPSTAPAPRSSSASSPRSRPLLVGGAIGCRRRLLRRLARRARLAHHRHLLRDPAAARRHPLHGDASPTTPDTPYFVVVGKVVLALTIFGWPSIARLMRSSVLQVKPNEYVLAARALGASPWRIIRSHILPNALAPVIVVSTINLGVFIVGRGDAVASSASG